MTDSRQSKVLRETILVPFGVTALLAAPIIGLYLFDEILEFIVGTMPVVEQPPRPNASDN